MKDLIKEKLEKFDFVLWDRFVEDSKSIFFYGWIKREKDSYKDFLIIVLNKQDNKWWSLTSSVGYDKRTNEILGIPELLIPCKRIENEFDIKNSIKLNA